MLQKIKATAGRFLRNTCGGATSIAAVAVTIMTLGGAALIIDHNHLVGQHDILKSAADAASLAATLELNKLPDTLDADEVRARILPVAGKYATLNVLGNVSDPDITAEDVTFTFDIDNDLGTVNTRIQANTGKTLVSSWLYGYLGPGSIAGRAGVESDQKIVEVVLAIDVSTSMRNNLDGYLVSDTDSTSRISIVKQAATELVGILQPSEESGISVGIVPWNIRVKLNPQMRSAWAANGWAEYPRSRYFAALFRCVPTHNCIPLSATYDLPPSPPDPWKGCLDEHRVSEGRADITPASEWFDPPADRAFAQAIYAANFGWSYVCVRNREGDWIPGNYRSQKCYGANPDNVPSVTANMVPERCPSTGSPILPLTFDRTALTDAIDAMAPTVGSTHSAIGILWGQRLLTPAWSDVWGHDIHPGSGGVRRAIVLLTDGADNQCGGTDRDCSRTGAGYARTAACTAAKAAGTEIFVVAAMAPSKVSGDLGAGLTACSSQGDRPGTYVFLNNTDPQSLRAAFAEIARQLRTVRRIY